ncbi:hypothetical protein C8R47DRAFT_1315866 [Mycena vitilis]|nr:hypothetical protein C8R47DRAFT_1315866 [Mycena vitilis]
MTWLFCQTELARIRQARWLRRGRFLSSIRYEHALYSELSSNDARLLRTRLGAWNAASLPTSLDTVLPAARFPPPLSRRRAYGRWWFTGRIRCPRTSNPRIDVPRLPGYSDLEVFFRRSRSGYTVVLCFLLTLLSHLLLPFASASPSPPSPSPLSPYTFRIPHSFVALPFPIPLRYPQIRFLTRSLPFTSSFSPDSRVAADRICGVCARVCAGKQNIIIKPGRSVRGEYARGTIPRVSPYHRSPQSYLYHARVSREI